jgi:hypothetical protein
MGEIRNAYKVLSEETEINQSAHRWEYNIIYLNEIEW